MTQPHVPSGPIRSPDELGKLVRAHRKHQKLTLETILRLPNLSTRFLSEFERGKETYGLGKAIKTLHTLGLEMNIQPRKANTYEPS